ncbi:MAG: hypothetical protein OEU32_12095 [Acidimicrobiia bacterium]|nr:hypothetical protein [Acidimicrobiia bacterium]
MATLRYVHGKKPIRVWSAWRLVYGLVIVTLVVVTVLAAAGVIG